MSDTLPKQELLLKLLKMTTSDNDGEALTAIRKANALLSASAWDWDQLIHSKIRIIEDPFKNLGVPATAGTNGSGQSHRPYTPPRPAQAPPVQPPKRTTWPLGIQPNRYVGFCYCCGNEVVTNAGFIFKPILHNAQASSDWKVTCATCNGTNTMPGASISSYAASRQRSTKRKPYVSDLS